LDDVIKDIKGYADTPAGGNLFQIKEDQILLNGEQKNTFHSLVAKLLYLSKRTRPDVLLAVNFLCTRVQAPDIDDWKKLVRVLKYLNCTKSMKMDIAIVPTTDDIIKLDLYVDASYGTHVDGKSHSGAIATLGLGAIYATSTKQKCVSKSSTEAELIAATDLISEGLHLKGLCEFICDKKVNLTLMQDNQATIAIIKNGKVSGKSKHVRIRLNWIKERVDCGDFNIEYKESKKMKADGFTKMKQGDEFVEFRMDIGVNDDSDHEYESKERGKNSVNSIRADDITLKERDAEE
jgi:hypothetical protein